MKTFPLRPTILTSAAVALFLSGCASYVERDEFNRAISDIHATDQKLQSDVDALSQKYDAIATEVAGRVRVETAAHFATGDATLREKDKPFLTDFAKVISSRYPDALITVEGFADPQGPTAYNRRLGLRRAHAVSDYLTSNGMTASQLRSVSYGEDTTRQVRPGETGPAGADNRRVSLAVDYAGAAAQAPTSGEATPATDQPVPPSDASTPPGDS